MKKRDFMKKIVIGALAFVAIGAAPGLAADLPARTYTKAPVMVEPVYNWTGFYIGGNVGGAFSQNTNLGITDPNNTLGLTGLLSPVNFGSSPSSIIGGLHAGYNWQVAPTWLVGIEGDFSFTSLRYGGSLAPFVSPIPPANSFANSSLRVNDLASIRGRFGYVQNQWLLYATGGGAWMNGRASGDVGCPITGINPCGLNSHDPFSSNANKFGWVAGAGVAYKIANTAWILGAEYLYYQFGGSSYSAPALDITTGAPTGLCCALYNDGRVGINSVRARLSYEFGGPVAARY
jgi:outer membrane immunogenic protein